MTPSTVSAALAAAPLPAAEARILLKHVLGVEDAALITAPQRALTPGQQGRYRDAVARRAAGEPVAYITGRREFYGRPFKVTPDVLIPRPETEMLVEFALEHLPAAGTAVRHVLDLGTGSGCIAVSIACERPAARVTALDASLAALALAESNALALEAANVRFVGGDWFRGLAPRDETRYDLILSNPPYVASGDMHLSQGDLRFEPAAALASGIDGLDALRAIIAGAGCWLAREGWVALEHGYDQGAACRALLQQAGFEAVATRRDLAGHERISLGRCPPAAQPRPA